MGCVPAHAALPGGGAAGGGRGGLVGPAIIGAFQVPDHLQQSIRKRWCHGSVAWNRRGPALCSKVSQTGDSWGLSSCTAVTLAGIFSRRGPCGRSGATTAPILPLK